jgi:dCMP deaminase
MEQCFGSFDDDDLECVLCDNIRECERLREKKKEVEIMEELTTKRISKDEYYLGIALAVSKRSTCLKRHYGAVIVKDDRIVSTGYNGSPRGSVNCCDEGECQRPNAERYSDYGNCPAVHAEQNAMLSASHEELNGSTLYLACECTDEDFENFEDKYPVPCGICKRMIQNSGITRVVNRMGEIK